MHVPFLIAIIFLVCFNSSYLNWKSSVPLPVVVEVPLMAKLTLRKMMRKPNNIEISMVASAGKHWFIIHLHKVMVDQGTSCASEIAEAMVNTEVPRK